VSEGKGLFETLREFSDLEEVAFAEPAEAWDIIRGHPDVIMAVIDTGADLNHPDLALNLLPIGAEDRDFADAADKVPDDTAGQGGETLRGRALRDAAQGKRFNQAAERSGSAQRRWTNLQDSVALTLVHVIVRRRAIEIRPRQEPSITLRHCLAMRFHACKPESPALATLAFPASRPCS